MSSIQRRIAAVTDSATNLIAQLDELDQLREQLRTALLLANSAPRPNRRSRKGDAIHVSFRTGRSRACPLPHRASRVELRRLPDGAGPSS